MKKFTRIILSILLVAVIMVTAVACDSKDESGRIILKIPKIILNGNTVSWDSVKNAKEYGVVVTGVDEEVVTRSTSYPLMNLSGTTKVKVRAIGDMESYVHSEYSAEVSYDPYINLVSPSGVSYTLLSDGGVTVKWKAVNNAVGYEIRCQVSDGTNTTTKETLGNVTEKTYGKAVFSKAGAYTFSVRALGNNDKLISSGFSSGVVFTNALKLANPTDVKLGATSSTGTITFKKVEHATRYLVRAKLNDVVVEQVDNPSSGSDEVSLDLNKFKMEKEGVYTFEVLASRSVSGSAFFQDSDWVAVNKKDDTTKRATMRRFAAPTDLKVDADNILTWTGVEDATSYRIELKSNTNTYGENKKDSTAFDLKTSTDLFGNGAENRAGGKALYINVYVSENLADGILKGLSTKDNIPFQSDAEPTKEGDIYKVENLMHLAYINKNPDAKYRLEKDINGDSSYVFGFSSTFNGVFDGNGKTIKNIHLVPRPSENSASLFGVVGENAVIKNFFISDIKAQITTNTYITDDKKVVDVGLIATENEGTIDNITIYSPSTSSDVISTNGFVGGIAITNSATGMISNISINITVSSNNFAGGITYLNEGKIFNARVYGSTIKASAVQPRDQQATEGDVVAGGITAINLGEIDSSLVSENTAVEATAQGAKLHAYAGGIVGIIDRGTISNTGVTRESSASGKSSVVANVSSSDQDIRSYAGAFAGFARGGIIQSSYNHYVAATSSRLAGGFIGGAGTGVIIRDGYTLSASADIQSQKRGGVIGQNTGATFSNFHYGEYETTKGSGVNIKTSYAGDVAGVVKVVKGSEMNNIQALSTWFITNTKVSEYMIVKSIPYLGKEYKFRSLDAEKKGEDRKNIAKVYIGEREIAAPSSQVATTGTTIATDIYDITEGEKVFVIKRIIQVK